MSSNNTSSIRDVRNYMMLHNSVCK